MFFLSWRQLTARKKQSLLILFGISFGTLLFVTISGLQLGMRKYITEQLLNNTAHIIIKGKEKRINPQEVSEAFYGVKKENIFWINSPSGLREQIQLQNYAGWYELLNNDPRVIDFGPRLNSHVVVSNGKFSSAVNLIGTVPDRQIRISSIQKYMKSGSFLNLKAPGNIIVGSGIFNDLGLKLNQYVTVNAGLGRQKSFKVTGVFSFGNEQADRSLAFTSLADIQILMRESGRVTEIAVALYDIDQSNSISDEFKLFSRDKVQDWQEANAGFMDMIKVQDFTRYFITISVLVVASFGIYNVLSIMINQKRREIAILRAIGYGPRKILQLILYQGLVLGISGGALGIFLGFLMCLYIGKIPLNMKIGTGNHLIISYDLSIYVTAFISAVVSSIIASYFPARSASKLTPIDIIRSE
jgi:lipoprotein-releasing system permease protein